MENERELEGTSTGPSPAMPEFSETCQEHLNAAHVVPVKSPVITSLWHAPTQNFLLPVL